MRSYGLIGYPLEHSFSERYFSEKFIKEGLSDCLFKAFPISAIQHFPGLLKANPTLKGLSVTIPYKEQVLQYIDQISNEVKLIGAANSIRITDNVLSAYNTDIIGFEGSFIKLLKPHHTKALVLGTGGASKAVQFVLKKLKFNFLVVSRSKSAKNIINYSRLSQSIMNEYSVVINCTPVGMWPKTIDYPEIPFHLVTSNHYFFDLIYAPAKTLFLLKAEERGATIKNGYDMLIIQAEESWKLWNEM
jgi:shikimate dehydrogenase